MAEMVVVGRDGEMEILEGKGKMAEMEDLVGEKSHFRRYRVPWNSECFVFGYTGLAAFEAWRWKAQLKICEFLAFLTWDGAKMKMLLRPQHNLAHCCRSISRNIRQLFWHVRLLRKAEGLRILDLHDHLFSLLSGSSVLKTSHLCVLQQQMHLHTISGNVFSFANGMREAELRIFVRNTQK